MRRTVLAPLALFRPSHPNHHFADLLVCSPPLGVWFRHRGPDLSKSSSTSACPAPTCASRRPAKSSSARVPSSSSWKPRAWHPQSRQACTPWCFRPMRKRPWPPWRQAKRRRCGGVTRRTWTRPPSCRGKKRGAPRAWSAVAERRAASTRASCCRARACCRTTPSRPTLSSRERLRYGVMCPACVAVVVGVWLALGNRHRLSAAHSHQLH